MRKVHDRAQALPPELHQVKLSAAGIDVGATSHFVAVPLGRDEETVREFGAFTADLRRLAGWLEQCGVETVVMESTGVYWIPLFELLEEQGFEVKLVDPRQLKHVPGRKSDVLDCQWLQQMHTFGLLSGAFRPTDDICVLRSYLRQRSMLVEYASHHIQHMQKALSQMNVKLQHVVEDVTGMTGMRIIRSIVAGERGPQVLAEMRDYRCKHDAATIALALEGNWREEHLFALRQALALYDGYQEQISACDERIETVLEQAPDRTEGQGPPLRRKGKRKQGNAPRFDVHTSLYRMTGVDITRLDGFDELLSLKLISEVGTDVTPWPTEKHFTSWLGLCPGTKVSGGKVLSSRTKPCASRAAEIFRLAANSLHRSDSALGAYLRRKKAQIGKPKAVTATAHKLARTFYALLRYGHDYVDPGQEAYERQYRERVLKNLRRRARELGYQVVEADSLTPDLVSA
ncbi:MAG: IS110 family transposase [Dehalococcoidia bacterium]